LFAEDRPLPDVLEEVARLGAQLLMQAPLEAEVSEFLGRDRCQRAATAPDARPWSRNGFRPVTVKTTAGPCSTHPVNSGPATFPRSTQPTSPKLPQPPRSVILEARTETPPLHRNPDATADECVFEIGGVDHHHIPGEGRWTGPGAMTSSTCT
jgi:hypothetical protein